MCCEGRGRACGVLDFEWACSMKGWELHAIRRDGKGIRDGIGLCLEFECRPPAFGVVWTSASCSSSLRVGMSCTVKGLGGHSV